MAADPFTNSILANSEGGVYRSHLPSHTFTQTIRLTNGLGAAYTPTAVGADSTVYTVANAKLYAIKS